MHRRQLRYLRAPTDADPSRSNHPEYVVAKDKAPKAPKKNVIGNRWAGPAMVISGVIGLIWIVVFYTISDGNTDIPWYSDLGQWNLVIGMGFIVAAFGFAMKWE